jgi:prephenate dehydrogenase
MKAAKRWKKICIIGVGLLGGSVARSLRSRGLVEQISGWARTETKLQSAIESGIVDSGSLELSTASEDADLVIAATPVQQILNVLEQASVHAKADCLFVDVGSTKTSIARGSESMLFSPRFCPSHPIAGSEKAGADHATDHLFVGKTVVITPSVKTTSSTRDDAAALWTSIGANVIEMTPEAHDQSLAITSHLPHLIASALAASTPHDLLSLVGTGWLDTTRIAAGDPELWRQIIEENAACALPAMRNFATIWAQLIADVENRKFDALHTLLSEGKVIRDAVGNRHTSGEE